MKFDISPKALRRVALPLQASKSGWTERKL